MSTNNWTQWPWSVVSNNYHGSPVEKRSLKEKDSTDCNNGNNKRKADAIDNGDDSEDACGNATTVTLESVMAEIKNLNERSERIEDMLKSLFERAQKEDNNDKIEKEEKQEDEEKEDEEKEDEEKEDEETEDEETEYRTEEEEEEEDSVDTDTRQRNGKLGAFWLMRFEQLRTFKEKHGHCRVTRANKAHCDLGQWVVAQRSELRTGRMTHRKLKVQKLNTLGFDWSAQSTPKKSRTKR